MPVSIVLDKERRRVNLRAWDRLGVDELLEDQATLRRMFADGTIDGTWSELADFTGVTSYDDVTVDGVRMLGEGSPWPPEARRAFAVGSAEAHGLIRMFYAFVEARPDHAWITRTVEEAAAILDAQESG